MGFRLPVFRLPRRDAPKPLRGKKRFTSVEAFFDDLFPLWFNVDFSPAITMCETCAVNEE